MYTLPVLLSTAPSVYSANNKYQTHNLWSVATVLTPTTGHYICNRNKNVCICVDLQTSMLNAAIVIACLPYLWPCCTDSKAHSTTVHCTVHCTLTGVPPVNVQCCMSIATIAIVTNSLSAVPLALLH